METWIPIILAVLAWVPALFVYLNKRREIDAAKEGMRADVSDKIVAACGRVVDTYQEMLVDIQDAWDARAKEIETKTSAVEKRVSELEEDLEKERVVTRKLRAQVKRLLDGVRALADQIRQLNQIPCWDAADEPDPDE